METTYEKKDDNTIIVNEVKLQEIIPEKVLPAKEYDYSFLKKQVLDIQKQWEEQLAQKKNEIDEINIKRAEEIAFVEKLITEADKLGIKIKSDIIPVDVINP